MALTFAAGDSVFDRLNVVGGDITYGDLTASTLQLGYEPDPGNIASPSHAYHLHEDSGSTVNDFAGDENGTNNGATQGVSGLFGNTAYSFDGTNDFVSLFTPGIEATEHSISMWIKTTETGQIGGMGVIETDEPNNPRLIHTQFNTAADGTLDEGKVRMVYRDENGSEITAATTNDIAFNDGSWHHLVWTYSGDLEAVNLFFDGSSVGITKGTSSQTNFSTNFGDAYYIGARNNNGTAEEFADVDMSYMMYYTSDISSSDAQDLHIPSASNFLTFFDKAFGSNQDGSRLQLTNGTVNVPANTTLKCKVHRTDGSNNIQESSDEIDLSQSFPIGVTGLTGSGQSWTIELTTFDTDDPTVTPTFDSVDLAVQEGVSGTVQAQNSTLSGSMTTVAAVTGTVQAQSSTLTASASAVASVTGTVQAQNATATGSLDNLGIKNINGTVTAQNATTSGSLSAVAGISGTASSGASSTSGSVSKQQTPATITGTVQAQNATVTGFAAILEPSTITGTVQAQNATVSGSFGATGGRGIDLALIPELPKSYAEMDLFVEIQFDNGTERYWTGLGDTDLDGDTFTGDGTILGVSEIREQLGLRTDKMELDLSALNSTLKTNALTKPVQDEIVNLWLVFWDGDGNKIGEKIQLFKGHIDDMQINANPDNPIIRLRAETGAIDWARARPRFYDPEDQKQEFPNDTGFDYVPQLSDIAITWGSNTIRPPGNTGVRNLVYGTERVTKPPVFYASPDGDCFLHVVQPAAAHEIDSFEKIYLDDKIAWTNSGGVQGDFTDHLRVKTHTGSDSQTADSDLTSEISAVGSNFRLRGVAYVYLRFKLSSKVYPGGLPIIRPVVNGKNNVTDPRDNTNSFTDNVGLCMRDYILDSDLGLNATTDDINDSQFTKVANNCEESVGLSGGGTEKRYTLNGSFDTDRTPRDILREMRDAMAGFLTYSGGQFVPFAGVDYAARASYDRTDLASDYSISTKRSRAERFNSVRGKFNNKDEDWALTNYPTITDSNAISDDNNKNIWQQFDLPSTDSHTMAQRIATVELNRNLNQKRVPMTFKTRELIRHVAGDVIKFTDDFVSWNNKKFRIDELVYQFTESGGGIKIIPKVTLREYDSSIYDWDPDNDEQSITSASTPDLPDSDDMHVQQYASTSDFPSETCAGQLRIATDDGSIQMGDGSSLQTVGSSTGKLTTVASGQVTLSEGTAVVTTGEAQVNNVYMVALGVDDPDADTKIAAKLFWDDSEGEYKVEFEEIDTDVDNPTVNYSIEKLDTS